MNSATQKERCFELKTHDLGYTPDDVLEMAKKFMLHIDSTADEGINSKWKAGEDKKTADALFELQSRIMRKALEMEFTTERRD